MVKGISRQVILVHGPDPKLFEQAIFILKDSAVSDGVSEDTLVKEAEKIIRSGAADKKRLPLLFCAFWAGVGALLTGAVWAITVLL